MYAITHFLLIDIHVVSIFHYYKQCCNKHYCTYLFAHIKNFSKIAISGFATLKVTYNILISSKFTFRNAVPNYLPAHSVRLPTSS